jgi:hypothetical protein
MAAKPSVLKRQRAEKAAQKREERVRRDADRPQGTGHAVATREDLEGYGVGPNVPDDDDRRGSR